MLTLFLSRFFSSMISEETIKEQQEEERERTTGDFVAATRGYYRDRLKVKEGFIIVGV